MLLILLLTAAFAGRTRNRFLTYIFYFFVAQADEATGTAAKMFQTACSTLPSGDPRKFARVSILSGQPLQVCARAHFSLPAQPRRRM